MAYYSLMRRRRLFIAVLLCLFFCLPTSVLAASDGAIDSPGNRPEQISDLDRQLLLELIKFSRFNIHFRLKSNYHQKWRFWTYALGREAGTAATFGGTLTDITQQAKGLSNLRKISKNAIRNGIASSMTGNAISGSASSLELVQNTWVMWQAKKNGFSPRASFAYIKKLMDSTDTILDKRAQVISLEPSASKKEVYELESALFKRIRQQLLYEFLTWSVHSRDQAWRENTFYTVDALQSFTRMTATILARRALDDRRFAKSAAICALVANSALTANPIFRNVVGRTVGKIQRHKLEKEFPFTRPSPSEDVMLELKQLQADYAADKQGPELAQLMELGARSERIDTTLERETKQIERYRQIAQQQSVVGPVIGMTALASSILSTVAIYNYSDKPKIANRLGFSGRISQSTGQVAALAYTPYTVVRGMILTKRLKARGELPEQLLQQRLDKLARIEQEISGTKP